MQVYKISIFWQEKYLNYREIFNICKLAFDLDNWIKSTET